MLYFYKELTSYPAGSSTATGRLPPFRAETIHVNYERFVQKTCYPYRSEKFLAPKAAFEAVFVLRLMARKGEGGEPVGGGRARFLDIFQGFGIKSLFRLSKLSQSFGGCFGGSLKKSARIYDYNP